jgi:hypothetical protein
MPSKLSAKELRKQARALQTPGVTRSLEEMRQRYAGHVDIQDLQRRLAAKDISLTDELFKMRGCDG